MGEAKRKCAAQYAWLTKLSPDEQHIVEVCKRLHEQLNKRAGFVQACFFYAFFLRKFLHEEYGIDVTPVVGWAGYRGNVFLHAWVEHSGKMIDLSLTQTNNPAIAPPGQLLVLDYPMVDGAAYDYMKQTSSEIAALAGASRIATLESMRTIAEDDARIDEYFKNAPPQNQYRVIAAALR